MRLIQLYKILIIIIFHSFLFSKAIKPNGKEVSYKLFVDSKEGDKIRPYFFLDSNGLTFSYEEFTKQGFKKDDDINLQLMSRTYMASNSNNRKKYQFELVITDGEKVLLAKDLKYNKKSSNVTSPESKKGFYFTHAGYWFEDVKLTKNLKITIKSKIKNQKIYVRLLANKQTERKGNKTKISPVDSQKNLSIQLLQDEESKTKKDWYYLNKANKQQFLLKKNTLVKVYCRKILDSNDNDENQDYIITLKENSQFIGDYMLKGDLSSQSVSVLSDFNNLKDKQLSKFDFFFITVPQENNNKDYSYYTFSIPDQNEVLIKLIEYELVK